MDLFNVVFRALILFSTLFLVTKLLGKKQVSQLSLFDYVIGISIGNFAAESTVGLDTNVMYGVFAILIFGFFAYLVSIFTMKSIFLRRFFMGTPTILIQKGKIMIEGLKKVKFDINDLLEECRISGYFDVSNIEYAIMEVNGKVSFLPKFFAKPVTIKDMNLKVNQESLCSNVIIDGKIMINNLNNMNKDVKWLKQQLKNKGVKLSSIILATLDDNMNLIVYRKDSSDKLMCVLE